MQFVSVQSGCLVLACGAEVACFALQHGKGETNSNSSSTTTGQHATVAVSMGTTCGSDGAPKRLERVANNDLSDLVRVVAVRPGDTNAETDRFVVIGTDKKVLSLWRCREGQATMAATGSSSLFQKKIAAATFSQQSPSADSASVAHGDMTLFYTAATSEAPDAASDAASGLTVTVSGKDDDELLPQSVFGHVSVVTSLCTVWHDKAMSAGAAATTSTTSKPREYIVSADRDNKIRVSRSPNAYHIEEYCLGHEEYVASVVSVGRGRGWIVSGSGDGTMRLWEAASGQELDCVDIRSAVAAAPAAADLLPSDAAIDVRNLAAIDVNKEDGVISLVAVALANTGGVVLLVQVEVDSDSGVPRLVVQDVTTTTQKHVFAVSFDDDARLWCGGDEPALRVLQATVDDTAEKKKQVWRDVTSSDSCVASVLASDAWQALNQQAPDTALLVKEMSVIRLRKVANYRLESSDPAVQRSRAKKLETFDASSKRKKQNKK